MRFAIKEYKSVKKELKSGTTEGVDEDEKGDAKRKLARQDLLKITVLPAIK